MLNIWKIVIIIICQGVTDCWFSKHIRFCNARAATNIKMDWKAGQGLAWKTQKKDQCQRNGLKIQYTCAIVVVYIDNEYI